MAEEEGDSGRAVSPYHEKCFPPYCDNASQVDKQAIAKINRNDLEDKYIVYADENFALKKRIRDHERQIQRLQTALARQDNLDKRTGAKVPASMYFDNARVDSLESQNKSLHAKVKVLKQQLMNHSYIHTKENRIAENREKQRKRPGSPDNSFRDIGQSQSARESKQYSFKDVTPSARDNSSSALKERVAVLEQLLETQKSKYKARIAQLEKNLASFCKSDTSLSDELNQNSKKVSDNVEMIRLRRLSKEQAARISTLSDQHDVAFKEVAELQAALKQASENADELKKQLEKERARSREAVTHVAKSVSHTETIRALEEQIRDLQNERKTLKDTNEQLLLLTTGPQSKSDRSLQENMLKQQISSYEQRLEELERKLVEKEEQIINLESLLQNAVNKSPSSVKFDDEHKVAITPCNSKATSKTSSKKDFSAEGCLGCEDLKHQLCIALMENQKLEKALKQADVGSKSVSRADSQSPSREMVHGSSEADLRKENENLRRQLELVENQGSLEKEECKRKLIAALLEIEDLKRDTRPQTPMSKSSSRRVMVVEDKDDCDDLKEQLCSALIENQQLKLALEKANKPENPSEDYDKLEQRLAEALMELETLRKIAAKHENCPKSSPYTPVPSSTALETVTLESETKGKRTPVKKSPSTYQVEQVPAEPEQKPVLIIVSKHEFDAALLKKKKFYSETEIALPIEGKQTLNCKLEICVYDLEMDNQLLHHLSGIEEDPHVFVSWTFVGLEQRTVAMPASQAIFHTNVNYLGPLSENMADHVKQRNMPIALMLEKANGRVMKVGEGSLDLSPAMEQPSRVFLRCVNLAGDQGSSTIYCSFKLHNCCQADAPTVRGESLEIGIGRMLLKNRLTNPQATHVYVEYSLLGHCGPELETDSVPKAEVMRFNHTKRLRVNESNASHLEPLLQQPDSQPLRFILLAEPCNLAQDTEVEEIGHADLNLREEMLEKDQDIVSAQVPVFDKDGEHLGSLSVTVIGISTLQNYSQPKGRS